ncbi:type II toxin-antitoxin system YafO family toxin [Chania multitudinisentens]|uniref:type II toxin-antitoxin system YafO family toxin n=1 Tax=Chania multitudinisentens TaxID=1639108 RepID=UPI0003E126CA|nr:type II toxin-antitoxin system YafO family toxin [Chania multitudinisentens]
MARVCLHRSLASIPVMQGYARELSLYLNGLSLSGRLGRNGGFERNAKSQSSGILKIHFKAPGEGFWSSSVRQIDRTCDNYMIYVRHWDDADIFQIIAVITPDAHARADAMIPDIIEIAELDFHSLNSSQLQELTYY